MADKPTSTINVNWEGGFKFTSQDTYGHSVIVDAAMKEGDSFDGMMPGDLLLTSLAGCSGIDVVNILQRQRQHVTGLEIKVTGAQIPDPPWTWVEVEMEYIIRGKGLREASVKRAIELSENKYCSTGATVAGRTKISSTYTIIEE